MPVRTYWHARNAFQELMNGVWKPYIEIKERSTSYLKTRIDCTYNKTCERAFTSTRVIFKVWKYLNEWKWTWKHSLFSLWGGQLMIVSTVNFPKFLFLNPWDDILNVIRHYEAIKILHKCLMCYKWMILTRLCDRQTIKWKLSLQQVGEGSG